MKNVNPQDGHVVYKKLFADLVRQRDPVILWQINPDGSRKIYKTVISNFRFGPGGINVIESPGVGAELKLGPIYCYSKTAGVIFKTDSISISESNLILKMPNSLSFLEDPDIRAIKARMGIDLAEGSQSLSVGDKQHRLNGLMEIPRVSSEIGQIFKGLDKYLFATGLLLIVVSSYQLFFRKINETQGMKLGTLTSILSVVKIKSDTALDWRDASVGGDLTENQLIYTYNASSAAIKFLEGHDLDIGENSLVRLKAKGMESGMDVTKGLVRARLEGDKPMKIQMNGKEYLLSGKDADVQINLQDEKGEIGVLSGEVSLEAEGTKEKINPTMALQIDGEKIEKKSIYYQITSPAQSSGIYAKDVPTQVSFSWTPEDVASVHISQSASLKNSKIFNLASGKSIPLEEGLWYFRIQSEKGVSIIKSIRVVQERAPQIFRPLNREKIWRDSENSPITLEWKREAMRKMKIEWDDGELHSSEVVGGALTIVPKPKALFKWRAKIQEDDRPLALWTEWQEVNLEVLPPPVVPVNTSPHEVDYQVDGDEFPKVELTWKGAGSFEIELKNPDGKKITESTVELSKTFSPQLKGTYEWRIRAIDQRLRASSWSRWNRFSISELSEAIAPQIERRQLVSPDEKVNFSFPPAPGSQRVFELSRDLSFKNIDEKINIQNDSVSIRFPETGQYFWRIKEYKADGTIDVGRPVKLIIEPVSAPTKPETPPELEIPIEEVPETTSWFDFFIPSAHASEKGRIKLQLPVKEAAKSYILRIYSDENLSNIVLEKKLNSKEFEWKNATPGIYYWQYAVVDFWDRTSSFSPPAKLRILAPEVKLPEKPKLLSLFGGSKVFSKDLKLSWDRSSTHDFYLLEISVTPDFKGVVLSQTTKMTEVHLGDEALRAKIYYWRVTAFNKKKLSAVSDPDQLIIVPEPLPDTGLASSQEFHKTWKARSFITWNPSLERYEIKDSKTGTAVIDGVLAQSGSLTGTWFQGKTIYNGELLRQSGVVAGGYSYLFQRFGFDVARVFSSGTRHLSSLGAAAAQVSGSSYSVQNAKLMTGTTSGAVYGLIFRNSFAWSENWETQAKLLYLMGAIKQLEVGADVITPRNNYLILFGLSYSQREYLQNLGTQTSIRFSLGIGKEL